MKLLKKINVKMCVFSIVIVLFIFLINTEYFYSNTEYFYSNKLSLDKLSMKWDLDKSSNHHGYSNYYDKILNPYRNNKINMIEIGIGTLEKGDSSMKHHDYKGKNNYKPGNSLRCWKDYFKNAELILGIDVNKDCMFSEEKIKTELCDSTNTNKVKNIMNKYKNIKIDFILDDGLHTIDAQVKTFKNFWPYLKKGGIYLIEDIHDPKSLKNELKKITSNKINIAKLNTHIVADSHIIKIFKNL